MKRFLVLLLLVGVGAGGYWGYRHYRPAPDAQARAVATPQGPRAVPIEVGKIESMTVNDEIEALGTLSADESVVIAPETTGRIAALGFREGERVEAGRELVKLDTAILEAEQKQAQADVQLARDTHERQRALAQRGAGTQVALEQATAQLAAAEARLQLNSAKLAQSSIRAPFSGVVGLRSASVGDYVSAGKQIVTLTNYDPIKVDFRVPETFLSRVRTGQQIQLRVDAVPDRTFTGQVFAIDPVVDVNGRAIRLRATIPNPDLTLKAGLFARVTIVVDQRENALVVPETAIVPDGGGRIVYIVEGGKAKRVPVELGRRLPGKVEVVSGLRPDMQLVTAGQMRLRDGATVAIKEKAAAPIQTSAAR